MCGSVLLMPTNTNCSEPWGVMISRHESCICFIILSCQRFMGWHCQYLGSSYRCSQCHAADSWKLCRHHWTRIGQPRSSRRGDGICWHGPEQSNYVSVGATLEDYDCNLWTRSLLYESRSSVAFVNMQQLTDWVAPQYTLFGLMSNWAVAQYQHWMVQRTALI